MSFSPVFTVVTYCLTISLYLSTFGSLRANSLGGGGGGGREGERGSTPKRACSHRHRVAFLRLGGGGGGAK